MVALFYESWSGFDAICACLRLSSSAIFFYGLLCCYSTLLFVCYFLSLSGTFIYWIVACLLCNSNSVFLKAMTLLLADVDLSLLMYVFQSVGGH